MNNTLNIKCITIEHTQRDINKQINKLLAEAYLLINEIKSINERMDIDSESNS